MTAASGDVGLHAAQRAQGVFNAAELSILADMKRSGTSERDARKKATAGGTRTKNEAARKKKQSDAVDKNADLANDLASGELGSEQLDAIANAAEKSNGDAATDNSLIDEIKNSNADEAGRIASRWIERRNDDGTKSRHERQREKRKVWFGYDPASGCEAMNAHGDNESMSDIKRRVKELANELYLKDGGRDLPDDQHPRTHAQRMYDAFHQLVTGNAHTSTTMAGTTKSHDGRPASTPGSTSPRNMMHTFFTVDDEDAATIRAHAPQGNGYLPDHIIAKYSCDSVVTGTVFSEQGEVLWFGRQKRHATPAQTAAMIARDEGCVICSADPSHCQAHHLDPYNSPKQGETNVEDMAMVCTDCHHWIHQEHLTLYWQLGPPDPTTGKPRRTWHVRPATPDEIAAQTHGRRAA